MLLKGSSVRDRDRRRDYRLGFSLTVRVAPGPWAVRGDQLVNVNVSEAIMPPWTLGHRAPV